MLSATVRLTNWRERVQQPIFPGKDIVGISVANFKLFARNSTIQAANELWGNLAFCETAKLTWAFYDKTDRGIYFHKNPYNSLVTV